ncbi:MAG: alpha-1,4-glucan--maltose-1-phosphate maltosyltransferase [Acidimicrobiia bacterium]|nr:alpha-1,4-glucan--maltose-1-phosphate maltosyltransferase [Acidimicrobiia bacterium]
MLGRIVIDALRPQTPSRGFPAKAAVGEAVAVSADIFTDGHDILAARLRTRGKGSRKWRVEVPLVHVGNDRWEASATFDEVGSHEVVVEAWRDRFATWRHDITLKAGAGQDVTTELEEGALLLDALAPLVPELRRALVTDAAAALRRSACSVEVRLNAGLDDAVAAAVEGVPLPGEITTAAPLALWVDRRRGLYSAWYELFPRSEGGLAEVTKRLPAIADMGFDVVYLPPVHPIGRSHRKGRDNTLDAGPDDVGSPWAIGSAEGGHDALHPDLGTFDDFDALVAEAQAQGMEIALDYALQCAPDHPWVSEHPEWFHHRPDGSIRYAENPPKKYQDIYPINFWPPDEADRVALWEACRALLEFWMGHGVRIFRVDNPHTKPIAFWAWLIPEIQRADPGVLFLAEAFTRPKVMAKLAEVGFTQSYTYFTWRTTKAELTAYATELSGGPKADYMRPNFWPNTPDILSGQLRNGSPAAFRLRLLLAATLVPSYGIYRGYEWCENAPQSDTNEEYANSEKYEIKERGWDEHGGPLTPFIRRINQIRAAHPALGTLRNTTFHTSSKDAIVVYSRVSDEGEDVVLCVVNLDPEHHQEDTLTLDLGAMGMPYDEAFEAHDELTGDTYTWQGAHPYVSLDPAEQPGHVLHLRTIRSA